MACVVVALAFSGVSAAGASAATIVVSQACVVNVLNLNPPSASPMTAVGVGFTPGDVIDLATTPLGASANTMADATGSFTKVFSAPILGTINPASQTFTLQAMDITDNVTTASTIFHVANLAVATKPLSARPNKKVTWSFSGFLSGDEIYVHYLHGKKVRATARFGRAVAPCGTLRKRAVFYPGGHAKYKSYTLQIDDSRHYSATALPRLIATLKTGLPF